MGRCSSSCEKSNRGVRKEKESEERRSSARKGRTVAKHCVFPMFSGSGSKSRLAKAVSAEPSGRIRDQKLHAAVVRSTCGSQN